MISDNGSQLVGAEQELREMIQGFNIDKLREFFYGKRNEVAAHNADRSTPEWVRRSPGKE